MGLYEEKNWPHRIRLINRGPINGIDAHTNPEDIKTGKFVSIKGKEHKFPFLLSLIQASYFSNCCCASAIY